MDFLTFTHKISIKPYQQIQIKKIKTRKPSKGADYFDNPLLNSIPQQELNQQEPIKSDQFDKQIEELIHNAQVAKRLDSSLKAETISNSKHQTKPSYLSCRNCNNNNMLKKNSMTLTPYQKYEKERQFTLENIKTKQDISNVNRYFDNSNRKTNKNKNNKYAYFSPLIENRRKIAYVPKTSIRITSIHQHQRNKHNTNAFYLSNALVKEFNKTNTNRNNLFVIHRSNFKTIQKSLSNNGKYNSDYQRLLN